MMEQVLYLYLSQNIAGSSSGTMVEFKYWIFKNDLLVFNLKSRVQSLDSGVQTLVTDFFFIKTVFIVMVVAGSVGMNWKR